MKITNDLEDRVVQGIINPGIRWFDVFSVWIKGVLNVHRITCFYIILLWHLLWLCICLFVNIFYLNKTKKRKLSNWRDGRKKCVEWCVCQYQTRDQWWAEQIKCFNQLTGQRIFTLFWHLDWINHYYYDFTRNVSTVNTI